MVESSGFRDMRDNGPFEDDAVGKALGDEIGEVDGRVDADGCEGCPRICSRNQHGFGEDSEVRDEVLEPWVCGKQIVEPIGYGTTRIFVTVVYERFL